MAGEPEGIAWIFISHASADIANVRRIRNYLEERGAAPLLFNLRALTQAEEFWPLIEREIEARSFFLYCESPAAAQSEWVLRERQTVEATARVRPKRVASINVDVKKLDLKQLDSFIAKTRVFHACTMADRRLAEPFIEALKSTGFQIDDPLSAASMKERRAVLRQMRSAEKYMKWSRQKRDREFRAAARSGWIVQFVSQRSLQREAPITARKLGVKGRLVNVLLDPMRSHPMPHWLSEGHVFDGASDPHAGPAELVRLLMTKR